jgi:hypothetical protein
MAGEVRSLWVSLKARTVAFESGMKRARKELSGFVNSIPGANLLLSKFGAALSIAGAAGFLAWVRHSGEALDATGKFAASLGIAVEKFQALAYAGDLAGVSTEQLQVALRTMTRGVDDAARGTGSAVEAFRRLGISAQSLKRLSPDEQVKAIADALAKVPDAADKAAIAMDVFGSRNSSIVNLLGSGREQIQLAEKDLTALGLTMSELDVRKVEAANDAWTRFGALVRGLGQRFAVELSPFIKAAADAAVDWVQRMGGVGNIVAEGIGRAVEGVGFLTRAFSALKAIAHGFEVVFLGIASAILDVIQQVVTATEAAAEQAAKVAKLVPGLRGFIPKDPSVNLGGAALKKSAEEADALLQNAVKKMNAAVADAGSTVMERQVAAWIERMRTETQKAAEQTVVGKPAGTAPGQWTGPGDFRWNVKAEDPESPKQTRLLEGIHDALRDPRPAVMVR